MKKVCVEILTRDREDYFAICMASLLRQTFKDWDLVIVDNSEKSYILNPDSPAHKILDRIVFEGHELKIVPGVGKMKDNIGLSRNVARDNHGYEICCRMDDDHWFEPDWMQKCYDLLISDDKIAAVGSVAPFMYENVIRDKVPKPFNEVYRRLPPEEQIPVFGPQAFWDLKDDALFQYKEETVVESHYVRSCFMYKRKPAEEVQGFPNEYGCTGSREEIEFGLKLFMKGYKLFTRTDTKAWHLHGNRVEPDNKINESFVTNEKVFQEKMDIWIKENKINADHTPRDISPSGLKQNKKREMIK